MTSTKRWSSALAIALLLAACSSSSKRASTPTTTPSASKIVVTSSAFADNARIPDLYTCAGANEIPPLSWTGTDPGKKVALIVDDPDAPAPGGFLHWAVLDLPAQGSVPPVPAGATQLPNGAGQPKWTGPCPPAGKVHHYHFTIHELVGNEKTVGDVKASKLPAGTLIGTYSRSG
jgi:Raf kinase inhibitor-like YbhB/YbcL family protein